MDYWIADCQLPIADFSEFASPLQQLAIGNRQLAIAMSLFVS